MKIVFIRHGATAGNLEKRYIGKTDEPLCNHGIRQLEIKKYPSVRLVISSPMKRCLQTAKLIYPSAEPIIFNDFRECDFGDFEGKNYSDLKGNICYQNWIDSGGELMFPNGELPQNFRQRSCDEFIRAVNTFENADSIAFVVHGGTIMSVMSEYALPKRSYYDYQIANSCGYVTEWNGKIIKILSELI